MTPKQRKELKERTERLAAEQKKKPGTPLGMNNPRKAEKISTPKPKPDMMHMPLEDMVGMSKRVKAVARVKDPGEPGVNSFSWPHTN